MSGFSFDASEPLTNQEITDILSILLRDLPGDAVAQIVQQAPWMADRFVPSSAVAPSLESEYARLCADRSGDIWLHLPRLVELVHQQSAQHVIELGVRGGVSTVAWLYGLQSTGGTLTSIDVEPAPDVGFTQTNWTFIQGDDLDPSVIAGLTPADIVFIDTLHTYAQTLAELEAYRPLVNPGGVIVLHDTELAIEGKKQVTLAIETFCEANALEWTNNPDCWGLGEIQIPA